MFADHRTAPVQPAFTVPIGFSSGNLPAGSFLEECIEVTLIKLTYFPRAGDKHRKAPKL
jgi:hypothetical protein